MTKSVVSSTGDLDSTAGEASTSDLMSKPLPHLLSPPLQHDEYQYINLVENILTNGQTRQDRTGTGTLIIKWSFWGTVSLFAPPQLRFSLGTTFPLLTTKRVFFRGVAEELLWFIKGDTNAKHLQEKDIHIWDGNGSREYLDSLGLKNRKEGDLGPVYGFQWRHFGAKYSTCEDDYTGQGFDQLASVIDKIVNKPFDRRIIMSSWNPADLNVMALPPCHMFCQFYVQNPETSPRLSCLMYQRLAYCILNG
jgi:thymidylate synthase